MKRKNIVWLVALILLIAGISYYYFSNRSKKEVINFESAIPSQGYIAKTITATGTVQPLDTVTVGAQVSGVVTKVFVDFNSVVRKGQLLATIDATMANTQREQASANLANAKSNLTLQQSTYERQYKLFKLGAISKAEYQLALNAFNGAKATINNTSAQLKLATKNLTYTSIYSPINGVVLNRNVSEGQTIASSFNAPTLFVITKDLTKMQVRAAVDEADIGQVSSEQHASFTVDAFPEDIFEGSVEQILLHPTTNSNVVTYTTLINVDNNELKLKPGMTASISIYIKEDSNALIVPVKAINFKPDTTLLKKYTLLRVPRMRNQHTSDERNAENSVSAYVWLRTGDTLREQKITTGINDDSYVQVLSGLSLNDEVITSIITDVSSESTSATQRSPFMPKMSRKPAGTKKSN